MLAAAENPKLALWLAAMNLLQVAHVRKQHAETKATYLRFAEQLAKAVQQHELGKLTIQP